MSCKDYMLFLIEMFIKHTDCPEVPKYNDTFFGPNTVCYGFLDFKPRDRHDLMIFMVDRMFRPDPGLPIVFEPFNTGKSVLFAVPPETSNTTNNIFYIRFNLIEVRFKPTTWYALGSGSINFSSEFDTLRKLGYAPPRHYKDKRYRIGIDGSCIFDGEVPIYDRDGKMSGKVHAYSRMSKLGQSIVSSFDVPVLNVCYRNTTCHSENKITRKPKTDKRTVRVEERDDLDDACPSRCNLCNPPASRCPKCRKTAAKVRESYPCTFGDGTTQGSDGCRRPMVVAGAREGIDHSLCLINRSSAAAEPFVIFEVSKQESIVKFEDKEIQYPHDGSPSVKSAPVRRTTEPSSPRRKVSRSLKVSIEEDESHRARADSSYEKRAPVRRATGHPTRQKASGSAAVRFDDSGSQRSRADSQGVKSVIRKRPSSRQKISSGGRRKSKRPRTSTV